MATTVMFVTACLYLMAGPPTTRPAVPPDQSWSDGKLHVFATPKSFTNTDLAAHKSQAWFHWQTQCGDISCIVTEGSKMYDENTLSFYSETGGSHRRLARYTSSCPFIEMSYTEVVGLLTAWGTGSAMAFCLFDMIDKNVRMTWAGGSYLDPCIHDLDGDGIPENIIPRDKVFDMSNYSLLDDTFSHTFTFDKAEIYKKKGTRWVLFRTVPWEDRFWKIRFDQLPCQGDRHYR